MFPPPQTPSTRNPSPNLPPARSSDFDDYDRDDLEQCLRSQITRIAQCLAKGDGGRTSPTVGVTRVPHAVGPRKPSLAQLEMEGYPCRPRLFLSR